jgi:hypothetical protein
MDPGYYIILVPIYVLILIGISSSFDLSLQSETGFLVCKTSIYLGALGFFMIFGCSVYYDPHFRWHVINSYTFYSGIITTFIATYIRDFVNFLKNLE